MAGKLFSTRSTDLMNKDLVQMLRAGRELNSKYAVVDADRRMTKTPPPEAKMPPLNRHWLPKVKSAKLRKIFG